ncbi:unnamed protein product [Boreogadus saida]
MRPARDHVGSIVPKAVLRLPSSSDLSSQWWNHLIILRYIDVVLESGRRNPGGGIRAEESGRRNPGGGVRVEESGRRNPGGGIRAEESGRRNPGGGIRAEESGRSSDAPSVDVIIPALPDVGNDAGAAPAVPSESGPSGATNEQRAGGPEEDPDERDQLALSKGGQGIKREADFPGLDSP